MDRDSGSWKRAIKEWRFNGVHVLADGSIDSSVASEYEVKLLPEYFIINKRGNFAQKPDEYNEEEIRYSFKILV